MPHLQPKIQEWLEQKVREGILWKCLHCGLYSPVEYARCRECGVIREVDDSITYE
jgi:hypothetical protein